MNTNTKATWRAIVTILYYIFIVVLIIAALAAAPVILTLIYSSWIIGPVVIAEFCLLAMIYALWAGGSHLLIQDWFNRLRNRHGGDFSTDNYDRRYGPF